MISRGVNRALAVYTGAVIVFLFAPLLIVFANALNADRGLVRWGGLTTEWFEAALENQRVRDDFNSSLKIAVLSVGISLVLAIAAALWWRTAGARGRRVLDATTYMRIILPEVVMALGLFSFFRWLDFELGLWAIVFGHVVFLSAFATVILQARLSSIDPALEEAARDLGARPHRVFLRVTLPLLMPAVVASALLLFSLSFDDVVTSAFLGGGTIEPLPVYILGSARFNITPEINAIGASVTAVTALMFVLAVVVVMRPGSGGLASIGLGRSKERTER